MKIGTTRVWWRPTTERIAITESSDTSIDLMKGLDMALRALVTDAVKSKQGEHECLRAACELAMRLQLLWELHMKQLMTPRLQHNGGQEWASVSNGLSAFHHHMMQRHNAQATVAEQQAFFPEWFRFAQLHPWP